MSPYRIALSIYDSFSLNGRISRGKYLVIQIYLLLSILVVNSLYEVTKDIFNDEVGLVLYAVCVMPVGWVAIASYIKRLHDLNRSEWMFLTLLIPYVNALSMLYVILAPGTSGANRYGLDPRNPDLKLKGVHDNNTDEVFNIYEEFYQSVNFLKQGKTKDALALLEKLINKSSNAKENGFIYFNIAVCQHRLGDDVSAIKSLKEAIIFNPSLAKAARKDAELSSICNSDEFSSLIKW